MHELQGNKELWKLQETVRALEQESKEQKKAIIDLQVRDSRAVSFVDYYEEKHKQDRVETWALPSFDDVSLPDFLEDYINHQGSETKIVRPYWEGILSQHRLVNKFSNGYEAGYCGLKKPDACFYPDGVYAPKASEFVAFGECKGDTWSGTSKNELGQAMMYAHRILDAQPERKMVYGFVTNNNSVVLIKAFREKRSKLHKLPMICWEISVVLDFRCGMPIFLRLLESDDGFAFPPNLDGHTLHLRRLLGQGRTCVAFVASYVSEEVVAKKFDDATSAKENASKINLASFALDTGKCGKPCALVPTVKVCAGSWLLITPLGSAFDTIKFELRHLAMILQTLKIVHEAGIIHRDVRYANIFWFDHDKVLLNDWGSAATSGEVALVEGCPETFRHPELEGVTHCTPEAKHDLYSLVKSTIALVAPTFRHQVFQDAFTAAELGNYEGVLEGFSKAGLK
jgi:Protein kinase domain